MGGRLGRPVVEDTVMRCPACGADYVAGDRFCGNCGERLPDGAAPAPNAAAPPPLIVGARPEPAAPAAPQARAAGPACPVCGTALPPEASRCEVCGFEPGASVVLPSAVAQMPALHQQPARSQQPD